MLGAHTNPLKMQIRAPNTVPNSKILQNTYQTELDISPYHEKLDLEMAANLGQLYSIKEESKDKEGEDVKIGGKVLNLHCSYDFRPTNFNFLLLSRFSFATKKKRI